MRGRPRRCRDRASTSLFANKLLIRTAEGTIRLRAGISRRQETGGTRVLTIHCLCVTINPTRERRCIYGWRSLRHRRNSLTGLSEEFRCGQRARQHHNEAKHKACHRTSPSPRQDRSIPTKIESVKSTAPRAGSRRQLTQPASRARFGVALPGGAAFGQKTECKGSAESQRGIV